VTYDRNNVVFITMMYQSQVPLRAGEEHCPYCGAMPSVQFRGSEGNAASITKTACIATRREKWPVDDGDPQEGIP
jgi:hypothetical protein